jgi:hypothetical protein
VTIGGVSGPNGAALTDGAAFTDGATLAVGAALAGDDGLDSGGMAGAVVAGCIAFEEVPDGALQAVVMYRAYGDCVSRSQAPWVAAWGTLAPAAHDPDSVRCLSRSKSSSSGVIGLLDGC